MKIIVVLFGTLMFLAGFSLFIRPDFVIDYIESNLGQRSLFLMAILVRCTLGSIFIITASQAKHPRTIRIVGVIFILAALSFLIMGQANFHEFVGSLIPVMKPYVPLAGAGSILFGGFLMYTFLPLSHKRS